MNDPSSSLEQKLERYRGLVRVSGLINSITTFDELLKAILETSREVFHCEAASLFMSSEDTGQLQLVLASKREGNFEQPFIVIPEGRGIAGWVWEHCEPLLVEDAYKDPRFFNDADRETGFRTRSLACAPLCFHGKPIGVLQLLNPTEKPHFDDADLECLCAYSSLTATAIEKLRAFERRENEKLVKRDLAIASEIQQELLARSADTDLPGLEVALYNQPAQEVGGDFYFTSVGLNGRPSVLIGDVSGKGISASLLMAQTMSMAGVLQRTDSSPSAILSGLNRGLCRLVVRGMFVTLQQLLFDRAKGEIEVSSAGHCPPIYIPSSEEPRFLDLPGALPAGILPETEYKNHRFRFSQGDLLILYTDGLSESRDPGSGRLFDEEMLAVVRQPFSSAEECLKRLLEADETFRRGTPLRDDLTVLVLRCP